MGSRGHLLTLASRWLGVALLGVSIGAPHVAAQSPLPAIMVASDAGGLRLQVDGRDVFVKGVNWDYFPVGTNYSYSLWTQPDDVITDALDREMGMLKNMGANAIRVYNGIPARWVRYIYERHGIWTVINHPLGRYGVTVDGAWMPNTEYSNPRVRAMLIAEIQSMVAEFRDTPGVLFWLLGNENNYGLTWKSAATENLPVGERDAAKARFLYSLFGEAVQAIKATDARPIAMANGDLQYLEIIAQEVKGLDLFGSNVYRGSSFRDLFDRVKSTLGVPVVFTEFGADAWNAREMREDQQSQARYLMSQWQEIYEQSAGKGLAGNAIGGFTFQWTDGWWKFGQETGLDVQDVNASWSNDAYQSDYMPDDNNMNEEWWGIVAKGPTDSRDQYELYPRAAYYALQSAYQLDPYAAGTDLARIRQHFASIDLAPLMLRARADAASRGSDNVGKVSVSGMRMELQTFTTGGDRISTPRAADASSTARPTFRGYDRMESYFVELEARPTERLTARMAVNILGSVADNPIDEIFYENRGRTRLVNIPQGGTAQIDDFERVRLYNASLTWDERNFRLDAFNRVGHYHWGYEGDFFGIYREANYGRNIDIYNGEAPLGMEFTGKRRLSGLKVALGPELWWGANPAAIVKYRTTLFGTQVTGLFQEDLAPAGAAQSSFAIPIPLARRATIHMARSVGPFGLEVGGMWAGGSRVGQEFQLVEGTPGNYSVLIDEIVPADGLGAKAKLTFTRGRLNWYVQGASMGLIADGGPTSVQTFAGWTLRDSGLNNQYNIISGFTWMMGNLQIAPNFLYQAPIIGPIPGDAPAPARKRNVIDDPFAVRANRETVGGELLLTWDPTPATWMYQWDNDMREDAKFAASVGYVFRHLPTTQDAAIGILGDGRTTFAFPGATPARDLWELRGRFIVRTGVNSRAIINAYRGTAEPNGDSQRLVSRSGVDMRYIQGQFKFVGAARFNDFGPYDYHRDFNLTFPKQYMADFSWVFGKPQWWDVPETRFGIRNTWRTLDRYSPRYCPTQTPNALGDSVCDPLAPGFAAGREWEIRTYLMMAW